MTPVTRFNPHDMADHLVRDLATGREELLEYVLEIIEDNRLKRHPQHILITGPRGMGKSFFMRLLQVNLNDQHLANTQFVLLPEEQPNITQPITLLDELLRELNQQQAQDVMPSWDEDTNAWQNRIDQIETAISSEQSSHSLLIAGIENLDVILERAFDSPPSRELLLKLLHGPNRIMLVATTLSSTMDPERNAMIYDCFNCISLEPWDEIAHLNYFSRRQNQDGQSEDPLKKQRIRAISRFTGGSPRMAVVLAELLLENNALSAAASIDALVDELTPYYQDLLERAPQRSALLFDALLRGGEPCSQSQLASRVGATQNRISQAFTWLKDNDYVRGKRSRGSRYTLYRATDRLFVQFYRKRYLMHGKSYTPLAAMADLLSEFYSASEQRRQALALYENASEQDAQIMGQLALRSVGIEIDHVALADDPQAMTHLLSLLDGGTDVDTQSINSAETMTHALDSLFQALKHCHRYKPQISGQELAELLKNSRSLSRIDKLRLARFCLAEKSKLSHWLQFAGILAQQQGAAHERLHQHAAALKLYRRAFNAWKQLDSKERMACIQGRIGWNLLRADETEQAVEAHQQANQIWKSMRNLHEQIWNQQQIAKCMVRLGDNNKALEAFIRASTLSKLAGDTAQQAWNLDQIAFKYRDLNRLEECLESHHKARDLWESIDRFEEQAYSQGWMGKTLREMGQYPQAIEAHNAAIAIYDDLDKQEQKSWDISQIASILFLQGKASEAWKLLDKAGLNEQARHQCIAWFADVLLNTLQQSGFGEAVSMGIMIVNNIALRDMQYDADRAWRGLCIRLITLDAPHEFILRLSDVARKNLGQEACTSIQTIELVLEYLDSDKQITKLEGIDPDMFTTIKAIVEETGR